MIDFLVVESSAEQRNKLCERLLSLQGEVTRLFHAAPQISLRPAAPQELSYLKHPDFVILGKEYLSEDLVQIASVKKFFPESRIIAEVTKELSSLTIAEQMVRLGVDDILSDDISATDFFRKIILLNKKERKDSLGKLIVVDSGKGGTGVTTIVASIGELLRSNGKKVCLVDLDTETQDLTRFLQVRPFFNENLSAVLENGKSIVKECVDQMVVSIDGDDDFGIVAPPVVELFLQDSRSPIIRSFIAVIEQLDKIYDVVVIDIAGLRGSLQLALQRIADSYLFVANLEVASVFSTIQAIQKVSDTQSKNDFRILLNARTTQGIPHSLVHAEIIKTAELSQGQVLQSVIPFSQALLSWPGSLGSMFIGSGKKVEQALRAILIEIGYLEKETTPSVIQPALQQLIEKTSKNLRKLRFHKQKQIAKKISISDLDRHDDSITHVVKAIEAPRKALPTIE